MKLEELEMAIIRHMVRDTEDYIDTDAFGDGIKRIPVHLAMDLGLKAEHFTNPTWGNVYRAAIHLFTEMIPMNITTISEALEMNHRDMIFVDLFDYPPGFNLKHMIGELMKYEWVTQLSHSARNLGNELVSWEPFKPIESIIGFIQDIKAPTYKTAYKCHRTDEGLMMKWAQAVADDIKGGGIDGVKTGIRLLDAYLNGGMMPGRLITIAATPGCGKTALGVNILFNMAKRKESALYVTIEMTNFELLDRVASIETGIPLNMVITRKLHEDQKPKLREAVKKISTIPMAILDDTKASWETVEASIRKECRDKGMKVVFIDYLQQFGFSGERFASRYHEITALTSRAKQLAMELNITVVLMSQLNRSIYSRKPPIPVLGDLKESGSIEADSDVVLFLYRKASNEGYEHNPDGVDEPTGELRGLVAKNRQGKTGDFAINADFSISKFFEG